MHQVGGETPIDILGACLSKPVYTAWCPCPPGQTRMKYDGTPLEELARISTLIWEPGRERLRLPTDELSNVQ